MSDSFGFRSARLSDSRLWEIPRPTAKPSYKRSAETPCVSPCFSLFLLWLSSALKSLLRTFLWFSVQGSPPRCSFAKKSTKMCKATCGQRTDLVIVVLMTWSSWSWCFWAAGKTPQDGPKEGSQVLLFLGAANMDPTVFSEPEEFRRCWAVRWLRRDQNSVFDEGWIGKNNLCWPSAVGLAGERFFLNLNARWNWTWSLGRARMHYCLGSSWQLRVEQTAPRKGQLLSMTKIWWSWRCEWCHLAVLGWMGLVSKEQKMHFSSRCQM